MNTAPQTVQQTVQSYSGIWHVIASPYNTESLCGWPVPPGATRLPVAEAPDTNARCTQAGCVRGWKILRAANHEGGSETLDTQSPTGTSGDPAETLARLRAQLDRIVPLQQRGGEGTSLAAMLRYHLEAIGRVIEVHRREAVDRAVNDQWLDAVLSSPRLTEDLAALPGQPHPMSASLFAGREWSTMVERERATNPAFLVAPVPPLGERLVESARWCTAWPHQGNGRRPGGFCIPVPSPGVAEGWEAHIPLFSYRTTPEQGNDRSPDAVPQESPETSEPKDTF